jgi:hypothetical protein
MGLFVAALAIASSAPAGLSGDGSTEKDFEGIHRVAIVSFLGDTFHGILIGTTVFQNKAFDAPVPEWVMNTLVSDHAVAVMGQRRRAAAV